MTTLELDPTIKQVVDDFDAHAKKRAAELLVSTPNEPLQATREIAFCLGYKAGVIDLGAVLREQSVVDVAQMAAVFTAACAWRDSPRVDARSLAGTVDVHEARLVAAVDAARAAKKEACLSVTPKSLLDWGPDGLYDDTRAVHLHGRCHAARDGECAWRECPQLKSYKSHCPLDRRTSDED